MIYPNKNNNNNNLQRAKENFLFLLGRRRNDFRVGKKKGKKRKKIRVEERNNRARSTRCKNIPANNIPISRDIFNGMESRTANSSSVLSRFSRLCSRGGFDPWAVARVIVTTCFLSRWIFFLLLSFLPSFRKIDVKSSRGRRREEEEWRTPEATSRLVYKYLWQYGGATFYGLLSNRQSNLFYETFIFR